MKLMCLVGKHEWEGCRCAVCGKIRDDGHDWSRDCEKCVRCEGERKAAHQWDGCKCKTCGKTRDESHDWSKDCEKCVRCGGERKAAHQWDGCKCKMCGKTRKEHHDWAKDCEKCSRCRQERQGAHKWSGCRCEICGKVREEGHDWSQDCEKCARCGKTRLSSHVWDSCKCKTCGQSRVEKHAWWNKLGKCTVCGQPRPRSGYCNPASTRETLARHAAITKAFILDSETAVPIISDAKTGKSHFLLASGELVEFTGMSEGVSAIRTVQGWAVIHHAVYSNDITLIQRVIELKVDLDATDKIGWTPMHHAASMGNGDIVRLLHRHGASLNLLSYQDKMSPLHVTVALNSPDAADALLALGADKEIKGKGDLRPLHLAAMKGRVDIAMLLLDYGAEVGALEINKSTSLHAAAYYGHLDIARMLIAAGAQPGLVDLRGNTPLSLAKKSGHTVVVAFLSGQPSGGAAVQSSNEVSNGGGDVSGGMSREQLLKQLEQYAREGRPIISPSMGEHFDKIVEMLDMVGAQRQGSQLVNGQDGRRYILDNYILPSGSKLKAGYAE